MLQLMHSMHQIWASEVLRHRLRVVMRAEVLHREQVFRLRGASLLLDFLLIPAKQPRQVALRRLVMPLCLLLGFEPESQRDRLDRLGQLGGLVVGKEQGASLALDVELSSLPPFAALRLIYFVEVCLVRRVCVLSGALGHSRGVVGEKSCPHEVFCVHVLDNVEELVELLRVRRSTELVARNAGVVYFALQRLGATDGLVFVRDVCEEVCSASH